MYHFLKDCRSGLLLLLLFFTPCVYGSPSIDTQQVGTIQAVDLASMQVQIGSQTFLLSDALIVLDKENKLQSRLALLEGAQIHFWYDSASENKTNPQGLPIIHKIVILAGLPQSLPK